MRIAGARCASEVIDDETPSPSDGSAFIDSTEGLGVAEGGTMMVLHSSSSVISPSSSGSGGSTTGVIPFSDSITICEDSSFLMYFGGLICAMLLRDDVFGINK